MNPIAVEAGTHADTMDTAREKVLTVLDRAKEELDRITDPVAKERRRAELGAEFWRVNKNLLDISRDEKLVSGEEGLIAVIIRHLGQLPGDNAKEADRIANKMTQSIEPHVFFNDIGSDLGTIIFNKIRESNNGSKTMVLLHPIVNNILKQGNTYLTFIPQGGTPLSAFEDHLRTAIRYDKDAFQILTDGLITAINDPTHGARNLAQLGVSDKEALRTKLKEIANDEKTKLENYKKEYQKKSERGGGELENLLGYFDIRGQEELQRLAKTLYDEKLFIDYVNELFTGGENERKRRQDETGRTNVRGGVIERAEEQYKEEHPNIDLQSLTEAQQTEIKELACKYFSDEFNERMRRMIGELHRSVDEKDFKTTWQEAAQGGHPFFNINSLMKSIENKLNSLKEIKIEQFNGYDLKFFVKDQQNKKIIVESVSKFNVETDKTIQAVRPDGRAVKLIERSLKVPVNEWKEIRKSSNNQVNWGEYIQTVANSIKTEVGVRKFLHDARALPFLTVGHDESYLQMLQKFAAAETDATLFDSVHTMYDAEDIDATSKLSEKMRELAFAKENWIFKPLLVDYDLNTGRNQIDDATFTMLETILRNKSLSERNRIFSAGVGGNFGLDLSGLTGPSQADPSLKENGTPNFASFGERDVALYGGFNLMTMGHHRWQSERATIYGILYNQLEGKHIKEYFETWDFNKLLVEQQKFVNSYVTGKDQADIDNNVVRLVDLFNIGKGGSVYDRGGWRSTLQYEGWMVQDDPGRMNIMKSWKAVENIGIEVLKDFVTNIDTFDSSFYKLEKAGGTAEDEQKRQEQRSKRRELFDYVYRQYFVAPEHNLTEEQIKQMMDTKFEDLETEKANVPHHGEHTEAPIKSRESNYKTFFYQALTRAMVQRMPTKFIRTELERTRKVSSQRNRAWDAVLDLAKNGETVTLDGVTHHHNIGNDESLSIKDKWEGIDKESDVYHIALQDIIAGEVLLRKKASAQMRKEVDKKGGFMHEVNLGDSYNLTPERLIELWENDTDKIILDTDEHRNKARKLNALTVLKATRRYLYTTKDVGEEKSYLDDFAGKFEKGLPNGPGFALATEELAREFIVHRASGKNMPRRAFGDNVRLEQGVVKEMDAFFGSLFEVGTSHAHSFDKLVKHIKTVRDTLDDIHGQDLAHRVSLWMATTAISMYKINSKDEWKLGGALSPYHSSLISFIAGGHTEHIWEWDRVTIREFMEALILQHILPREPYSAQNAPAYEQLYVLEKDEHGHDKLKLDHNGNPIPAKEANGKTDKKRRKQDFHYYAENLVENFLQNPLKEVSLRLLLISPILFIAMIVSMIIQAYKLINTKK